MIIITQSFTYFFDILLCRLIVGIPADLNAHSEIS